MNIAVVGSGYVGLVVGACLSETGNHVICVDRDEKKIKNLTEGKVPIYEPGLEELIARNVRDHRLHFSTDTADAVERSDIIFIAVGTPQDEDGSADLSHVLDAAKWIGRAINNYKVIVTKSTVPVGTNQLIKDTLAELTGYEYDVVSNPEFLREGAAISDFMRPDRIVVGTPSERATSRMRELYAPFIQTGRKVLFMDPESAELTKYAANSLLATRISFMNEIAQICDKVGGNVEQVRKGIGSDSRLGSAFLFSGAGYGGSCFPKDVRALLNTAESHGYSPQIIRATDRVNEDQKRVMFQKVYDHFEGSLAGKHFALWGLAFKPQTDDMREAPSLVLIEQLLDAGATVTAYDPAAIPNTKQILGDRINYADSAREAARDADALILITEWTQFRQTDLQELSTLLREPLIFDGRNLFSPEHMAEKGFTYYGIGIPATRQPQPA